MTKQMDPILKWFMEDPGSSGNPGRIAQMSEALGITRQAVNKWERTPIERVREVEKITGIPRHVLRPDIFDQDKIS